ncbi:MAG: A/G-specific adenine glycosylase [Chlamydiota bacterium]|nr:A/G-specific adenine glycosylase [Chlamydiota bacterium]
MDSFRLKKWFNDNKRDLPWRDKLTPYRVWVSEVMLQQTQVAVVIPYFIRWMERFPTIKDLAAANIDEVIKLWEGLGYYSRARNLHEGAKYIETHYNGKFPENEKDLLKIKGIGNYTVGAIRSFAFHKKTPAIDGNVIRVATRFYGIEDDVGKVKTQKVIREKIEQALPEKESWVFNEALIELGAKVCSKKPKCCECPLKKECYAFHRGVVDKLPYKAAKMTYTVLHRSIAVIISDRRLLLKKGRKGEIMQGLHEFPYFEKNDEKIDETALISDIKDQFGVTVIAKDKLEKQLHSYTRYRVHLYPRVYESMDGAEVEGYQWIRFEDVKKLAFSSGHRRVYHSLMKLNL